jgi:hypothetical protein
LSVLDHVFHDDDDAVCVVQRNIRQSDLAVYSRKFH